MCANNKPFHFSSDFIVSSISTLFLRNLKSAEFYYQRIPMLFAELIIIALLQIIYSWIRLVLHQFRCITMKLRNYQQLLIYISHIESRLHPVDENGCIFAQSVSLYQGFSTFGWKPMKSKLLLKSTVGGLHGSDVNRWILFCSINHSVVTYRLVKCQYLISGPSHSTMHFVWNELIQGKSFCPFPIKNVFRLFSYPFSLAATEETCSGLKFSGWSIPVSFMLVVVTLSLHRKLSFFDRIVPAHCLWMVSDAFICSAILST